VAPKNRNRRFIIRAYLGNEMVHERHRIGLNAAVRTYDEMFKEAAVSGMTIKGHELINERREVDWTP